MSNIIISILLGIQLLQHNISILIFLLYSVFIIYNAINWSLKWSEEVFLMNINREINSNNVENGVNGVNGVSSIVYFIYNHYNTRIGRPYAKIIIKLIYDYGKLDNDLIITKLNQLVDLYEDEIKRIQIKNDKLKKLKHNTYVASFNNIFNCNLLKNFYFNCIRNNNYNIDTIKKDVIDDINTLIISVKGENNE